MNSTAATEGNGVKIFSTVIIITQNDTRNIDSLISCLKKESEAATFRVRHFQASEFLSTDTIRKELV